MTMLKRIAFMTLHVPAEKLTKVCNHLGRNFSCIKTRRISYVNALNHARATGMHMKALRTISSFRGSQQRGAIRVPDRGFYFCVFKMIQSFGTRNGNGKSWRSLPRWTEGEYQGPTNNEKPTKSGTTTLSRRKRIGQAMGCPGKGRSSQAEAATMCQTLKRMCNPALRNCKRHLEKTQAKKEPRCKSPSAAASSSSSSSCSSSCATWHNPQAQENIPKWEKKLGSGQKIRLSRAQGKKGPRVDPQASQEKWKTLGLTFSKIGPAGPRPEGA